MKSLRLLFSWILGFSFSCGLDFPYIYTKAQIFNTFCDLVLYAQLGKYRIQRKNSVIQNQCDLHVVILLAFFSH